MSRIDDLIAEMCPDGVDFKNFCEVCEYIRGVTYNKNNESKDGKGHKLLRANNITLSTNTLNYDDVKIIDNCVRIKASQWLKANDILICAGSGSRYHIGKVAYINNDIDYSFGGFMAVLRVKNCLSSRFLFHILTSVIFSQHLDMALDTSTINNLNSTVMNTLRIPIPPLPIQEEIVRILDVFTTLEARKKQYAHYRRLIISNNDNNQNYVPLSKLGKWFGGGTPSMNNREYWTSGTIPWVSSKDMIGSVLVDTQDHITSQAIKESSTRLLPENTVAIVARSGILKHTLPIVLIPFKAAINQDIKALVSNADVSSRYVAYALRAYHNDLLLQTKKAGGTVDSLDMKKFLDFSIPVPILAEQARIVEILDRFDALINDITVGLPAEIEARRKQYEYYRDRLLSFKEKVS